MPHSGAHSKVNNYLNTIFTLSGRVVLFASSFSEISYWAQLRTVKTNVNSSESGAMELRNGGNQHCLVWYSVMSSYRSASDSYLIDWLLWVCHIYTYIFSFQLVSGNVKTWSFSSAKSKWNFQKTLSRGNCIDYFLLIILTEFAQSSLSLVQCKHSPGMWGT